MANPFGTDLLGITVIIKAGRAPHRTNGRRALWFECRSGAGCDPHHKSTAIHGRFAYDGIKFTTRNPFITIDADDIERIAEE